ncbi:MAG: L-threonylcarbamoyladenylate synthase [Nitrospiraceae bacterium]
MSSMVPAMARMLRCDVDCQDDVIHAATQVVADSGIIAFPTESFYGLGVNPMDAQAVARLCSIKSRPSGKPILVLIGDPGQLSSLISQIPPAARVLMEQLWPGPLTIIFPASNLLPGMLTGDTGTIGIRLTAHPLTAAVLRRVGPLTGTSANRSGEPPGQTPEEVQAQLGSEIDLILDGGRSPGGVPSTVIDARSPVRFIREGRVSKHEIQEALSRAGMKFPSHA